MILFIFFLMILSLYKCKPLTIKEFYSDDYISIDETKSINGICIMLILLNHTFARISPQGVLDEIYIPMRIFLGQFVVVPFLFYSGYGIMESIKRKDNYVRTFPEKRFLKLFYQFALITVIYIILNLCVGNQYSVTDYILSFTGITSIGNGGWYMLSTFYFYICIIVCFNIFKKNHLLATIAVAALLIVLMIAEIVLDFESYYYNTTFFFAVGMFFSLYKETFDKIVMKNNIIWIILFVISVLGFANLKPLVAKTVVFYPVWCGFGMLMILLFSMKVKIKNKLLIYLGETTFFIFTLQGIPQIILTKYISNNIFIYTLTIVVSLLLAAGANILFKNIKRKQFFMKK